MRLHLPWPPSVNHYWARNRSGGMRVGAEGLGYRHLVAFAMRGEKGLGKKARLKVSIEAHPPDRRRRDLDNLLKGLLDALQHAGAYGDDEQIDDLSVRRRFPLELGCVVVDLEVAA